MPGSDDEADATSSVDDSSSTSSNASETDASETDASEADASDEIDSSAFVCECDAPVDDECNIITQDCDEGEKCIAYSSTGELTWDANKCVPVTGDRHVGESCHWDGIAEGTDDCDANSMCWGAVEIEGALIGTCVGFCTGTFALPECPPTQSCMLTDRGALAFCDAWCDPLLQDCEQGQACYWTDPGFECLPSGEVPIGGACEAVGDCAPGGLCTEAASLPSCVGSSCCTGVCDVEAGEAACADQPGTSCVPLYELGRAPAGYEAVGACVLQP
ncbi:ribulose phosphate epimerase [Nannocystaceae bacterium ST9]